MREDDEDGGQGLADEQRADLLALQAAAAGGQPAPGGPVQVQEQGADEELPPPSAAAMAAASMLVGIVRPLVEFGIPTLRGSPDALWAPVPEGVAVVVDHYGGGVEWMRHPLARLGFALAPLAAYGAAQAMTKPKEGQGATAAISGPPAGAPDVPGAKTVSFGAVVPAGEAP
ncbi:MAG TPA: hypothetical protein VGE36_14255 [Roseateles sp.]